jgi:hypothetical protein
MRRTVVVLGLTLSVLMVVSASAGMNVGAKVWVEEIDGVADGVAVGPTLSIDLGDSLWLSGSWLVASLEDDFGVELTSQDAEMVLALSMDWVDVGVGFRYSEDEFVFGADAFTARKMGPMAYVGLGSSFGDSALGWYGAGSWMFYDLNDDWGDDGGKHYNVEAGLSLYLDPLSATVGYRIKDHYDLDDVDFKFEGITASASYAF